MARHEGRLLRPTLLGAAMTGWTDASAFWRAVSGDIWRGPDGRLMQVERTYPSGAFELSSVREPLDPRVHLRDVRTALRSDDAYSWEFAVPTLDVDDPWVDAMGGRWLVGYIAPAQTALYPTSDINSGESPRQFADGEAALAAGMRPLSLARTPHSVKILGVLEPSYVEPLSELQVAMMGMRGLTIK